MFKTILSIIMAMAAGIGYAQEWEYSIKYVDDDSPWMHEAKPLQDGNIAVTYDSYYPSSSLRSRQPGLLLLSPDGEELARNSCSKAAFWGYYPHVLSDEDGTTYMLAAYNPDHDSTCANYFMNFDNPPDYSILGLYKLDQQLSVVESHEFQIPIDTTDTYITEPIFGGFNDYCGNIYVFSTFIDEGSVVGGYIKKPSFDYYHPHGNDSIFFFRIGFDGTLISHVGYEMDPRNEPGGGGLNWAAVMFGYNLVKLGSSYYCFLNGYPINGYTRQIVENENSYPGYAYRLDSEFNIVDVKHYHQRNGLGENRFMYAAYIGSHNNSVYLSCGFLPPGSYGNTGCALYEYAIGSDTSGILHIERYTERNKGNQSYDQIALIKGIGIASDNSVYFAYALDDGKYGMTIERLSPNFDTISTLYYGNGLADYNDNYVQSIEVTESDELLMTFISHNYYTARHSTTVVKFPAEAFLGTEEAHASDLKVAVAYPNPGSATFNLYTGLSYARLEVYDATGCLIHGQEITESETAIDAEAWPSGIYVWKVFSGNKEAETGKWLKE